MPIATAIVVIVLVIIGGIVVLIHPASLSFDQYVKAISVAVAGLAIGRGLDSRTRV